MTDKHPLKIWTLAVGEPSPIHGADVRRMRKGLLSRYLRGRGHDVTWFTGTVDHRSKTQRFNETTIKTDTDGTKLVFLHGRLYHKHVSFERIGSHRDGAKSFRQLAPNLPQPDVIACSYPTIELAAAVRDYATARNIPFILDLRDMWPDIIADVAPKPLRWAAKLILLPWYISAYRSMRAATALTGITEPFVDWGLSHARRKRNSKDRAFHLASDPESVSPESLQAGSAFWDQRGVKGDRLTVVFAGMLSARHDFETIIEGARLLPADVRDKIQIVLCGKGEAEEKLKSLAQGLPHVTMAGYRNLAEIQALYKRSHAGLLPYFGKADFAISYPNKVGEYMGAGLPLVSCLEGEVSKLIRAEHCGLIYEAGNPQDFANTMLALIEGKAALQPMKAAAQDVYKRKFDSNKIYNDYADFLESFAQ